MTQALSELLRLGFEELSFYRVEADVFAHNDPGRHLAEKVGMTLEGTVRQAFRKRGAFIDICVYSILYDEWLETPLG